MAKAVNLQRAVDEKLLLERVFAVRADEMEENDDRTISVVFSTEYEYRNWFGREIISHDRGAADLSRMGNKTAPVLLNHSRREQIGVVENARIVNRQGVATLRFSRSELGEEVYRDILDGIRSQISYGYRILKFEVDKTDPNDPLHTIKEWMPFEVSVVTMNADPNALVQRSDRTGYFSPQDDDEPTTAERGNNAMAEIQNAETQADNSGGAVNVQNFQIYERGRDESEQTLAMKVIGEQGSLEDFERQLREKRETAAAAEPALADAEREDGESKRFNLADLIFQQLNPDSERGKLELEEAKDLTSDAEKRGYVRRSEGLVIPHSRLDGIEAKRDITTAAASGGHLVGEDVRGDLFVDALRNKMVVGDLCQMVTGLMGNASIPAETTAPTAAWLAETTAPTESQPVIGQIALTPKFVRGYTEISRTLIAQGSVDVEMIIRNSLMKSVALVVDLAIFSGSGASNQPSGIDQISGLSTTTYATAITNATLANLVAVEQALDDNNAPMENRAWICNPNVRSHYRQTPLSTGGMPSWYNGMLLDTDARVTNQVADGVAYYGAWMECFVGLWDSIEVLVNPYSKDTEGIVRITAWQMADINFAHGTSFAKLAQA